MRPWRALTRNRAWTSPDAGDPRLCTPAYAVPFVRVWEAALEVASTSRGWRVTASNPQRGEIAAEATTRLWRFTDDVWIRVSLDEEGQTRVDLTSQSRVGRADLGTNARRIARFLHDLERRILPEERRHR
jgi:uncharacterized protein (DUF1499 family)